MIVKSTISFFFVFLIFLKVTKIHSEFIPYTVTPLENKAGIYYYNIGHAKISNEKFTLLSYMNITFYHKKLNTLKRVHEQIVSLCSVMSETVSCKSSIKLSQFNIPQLETKFDTIFHLVGHKFIDSNDVRKRRGIFDGVSHAFNWLFGIPDADDAKYYAESIKKLNSDERQIEILMKQQIHVISSAIKNYNASAQSLKVNEEKLNENIEKFNKYSRATTHELKVINQRQAIIDYISLLMQMTSELNQEFDNIISAILFAKQNNLHPSIISPRDLKHELSQIKLNSDIQFPIPIHNYNNIYKYFSICELSAFYDNDILIFTIKIPLVHDQLYNIYNLIPLPVRHNSSNLYSYIDTSYPYLLLSTTKTHYGRLRNLFACKKLSEEDYICENPTIHLTSERPVCETLLRSKLQDAIPKDCPTRTITADLEIWHPLSANSWLFIMSHPTTASISCDKSNSKIYDVELNSVGIFAMRQRCKCYTFSTVLVSSANRSTIHEHFVPDINILSDDCCRKQEEILQKEDIQMEPMKLNNLNLDDLRHSQHKLDQFDEILQKNLNNSNPSPYSSSFFKILLSILSLIVTIFIICCCCCNCRIPYFGKLFPNRKGCCGLPNICITNHNERLQLSEEQVMRLSRLRRVYEDDPDNPSDTSRDIVPMSTSVSVRNLTELNNSDSDPRLRKSFEKRFRV